MHYFVVFFLMSIKTSHNYNNYLEGIITMILAIQFSYFERGNKFGKRKMYKTSITKKKSKYSIPIKHACYINTCENTAYLGI